MLKRGFIEAIITKASTYDAPADWFRPIRHAVLVVEKEVAVEDRWLMEVTV